MRYGSIPSSETTAAASSSAATTEHSSHLPAILFCLTLFTTGSHIVRHSLSGLGPSLMSSLGVERTSFALLFSAENVPGILLPFVGGVLLTYVPLGPTAVFLTFELTIAAIVCAAAVEMSSYNALLTGRVLFGLCEGLLVTVQGALIARTFRRRRVATAFGAMLLVSRSSSFLGIVLPTILLNRFSLSVAMWVSAWSMLLPFVATIVHLQLAKHLPSLESPIPSTISSATPDIPTPNVTAAAAAATALATALRAIRKLHAPFWIAAYTFMTVAASVMTFVHFAPDVFDGAVPGFTSTRASLISGAFFLAAGLTAPLVGVSADRVGQRDKFVQVACAASAIGLAMCAAVLRFPSLGPAVVVVGMALIMSCLCIAPVVLLACVALVVPPHALPVALGAYKALENAGNAVIHLVVGRLRDSQQSYVAPFVLLAALAASALPPLLALGSLAPQVCTPAPTHHKPVPDDLEP